MLPKSLSREDFKYIVSLPCPVKAPLSEIQDWMADQGIKFCFSTAFPIGCVGQYAHFKMLEESHATMFALKWS